MANVVQYLINEGRLLNKFSLVTIAKGKTTFSLCTAAHFTQYQKRHILFEGEEVADAS